MFVSSRIGRQIYIFCQVRRRMQNESSFLIFTKGKRGWWRNLVRRNVAKFGGRLTRPEPLRLGPTNLEARSQQNALAEHGSSVDEQCWAGAALD